MTTSSRSQIFIVKSLPQFQNNDVFSAQQIPPESLGQIALTLGLIEVFAHKGKITPADMFEDGRKPGEFGFDPLGFGKNPADFKVLQVGSPSCLSVCLQKQSTWEIPSHMARHHLTRRSDFSPLY